MHAVRPALLLVLFSTAILLAVPPAVTEPTLPEGTDAALKVIAGLKPPAGMKVELFAAEPKLASPVAIALDEKGRVFVAEEQRFNRGTEENRSSSWLLEDDLQVRTLDDRLAMFKKWAHKYDGGMEHFTRHSDKIRLLEDTDGDGKADRSTIFADGFNAPLDGLAAGVLAKDGEVYFTCIPNLWKLRDTNNDGIADERTPLLTGFGVNCAFLGHDLHGLIFGPDGKLYFSVGDRGYDVTSKEGKRFQQPHRGAVFRCDADGRNLEVVMKGLRNPQELAFDQFGNLFADDNNCDKGDHARLVYVLEDGDAGWNMAYQTIPEPYLVGPWFAERLWHLPHAGQPAYVLPPVGKIGTGPSGFLFTSGTSLADRYANSFLMCNYSGVGGLESFKVKTKGAGFEIDDYHTFMGHNSITDAEFGYDGKLYVSDFVGLDWSGASKGGRIYSVYDPEKVKSSLVVETKKLFSEGFKQRPLAELETLLGHPDQRVRLRAQFAMVDQARAGRSSKDALSTLTQTAAKSGHLLARMHAIWGLGQLATTDSADVASLTDRLADPDAEVRAQAVRCLGSVRAADPAKVAALLTDASPRVQSFAAQSVGKLGITSAIPALCSMLALNKDEDPYLRHTCVAALARIGDAEAVAARASDANPAVRLAVVLVQRRLGDARVVQFLKDADPFIRTEAARAIHDLPMESLYPELAKLLPQVGSLASTDLDPLARRCINACFRLGRKEDVAAVFAAASDSRLSLAARREAIMALRGWADPSPRDRVTGYWRPLPKREVAVVREVVDSGFETLLAKTTGSLQTAAIGLIEPLKLSVNEATFAGWVGDARRETPSRVAALRVLASRKSKELPTVVARAIEDASPLLRAEARDVLASADAVKATALWLKVLADSESPFVERQRAVVGLGKAKTDDASKTLDSLAEQLAKGGIAPELQLDVLTAIRFASNPARTQHRKDFEAFLTKQPRKHFTVSLQGGDAERGREIFFNHTTAQCIRCHKVGDAGGAAGPDLTDVVKRNPTLTREHLLESMLDPGAKIAPGFGNVSLSLADGRQVAGVLVAEDAKTVTVQIPEGRKVAVAVEDIERRSSAASPMPSIERTLTPAEVRDLVAFLMEKR